MPQIKTRRDWALDWLTALLPVAMVCVFSYGWAGVVALLTAWGGYLAATVLCNLVLKRELDRDAVWDSVALSALVALCLPPAAAVWLAPLAGGIVGVLTAFGSRARELAGNHRLPLCHPVAVTVVLLRLLVPAMADGYVLPMQWRGLDAVSAATPLAALGSGETTHSIWYLLFGVRGGAMGEICALAVLIGALFLVLRRRVRLIAPACMLATVALLSWIVWGMPLYALLAGSVLPAAVLLADRRYAPRHYAAQIIAGVVAGAVTVWMRAASGWTEGTAVGLMAAATAVYGCRWAWCFANRWRLIQRAKDIFMKIKNKG